MFQARRRLPAQLACPRAGMQDFCCSPSIPRSPPRPSRRALKLEMVAWKLCANMQIISLCRWHEMAYMERIKAWQLQKWGRRKGVQRVMLSSLVLLLPSKRAGCREKKASRLAWGSVTSPPSFPRPPPSCLVNAAEHRRFGWNLLTYRAASLPRLQYVCIFPGLVY